LSRIEIKIDKKELMGYNPRLHVTAEFKMHTFTIAGLIRNLAPAFIAFLASSTFKTVPTCRILNIFRNEKTFAKQSLYRYI
jgi:hypothetical protein